MGQDTADTSIKDGMNIVERAIKRCLDIVGACFGLLLLSPLFLLIYLLLKKQGYGSAIFKQERIGYKGESFYIYKFRTMCEEAEVDGLPRLAEKDDARLTPVGKYLRVYHLDELPQLWNVLKGDMSFVGPRPERVEHMETYGKEIPEFDFRTKVKGGLTGYAQIYGKYNTSPYDKLRLDMMYVENYSLILDIKLILQTLRIILSKESTEGFEQKEILEKQSAEVLEQMKKDAAKHKRFRRRKGTKV